MPKQREGPPPGRPARGPGVDERDARLLPRSESPRNSRAPTSPSQHPRSRRRQGDPSWRGFSVRLYLKPGSEAAALYSFLKLAAQRYGLQVGDVREIRESDPPYEKDH